MKYQAYGYAGAKIATQGIDRETFERVKEARATCLFALEIEETFALLFDNFAEFEVELLRLAEFSLLWLGRARDHTESMQERLLLDRRLVNLLTSCRLYLDQTDDGISTLFGNPSGELTSVKEFKNDLYDSHWGYRLMEALRNHVQHFGLAARVITLNSFRSSGDGPDYSEFTVYPQANVKALAENPHFKKTILGELRGQGENIDLRGPAREYMSCFVALHNKLRRTIGQRVEDARRAYESATRYYASINGQEVKFAELQEFSEDGDVTDEISLVTNFLDYYDNLLKRNSVNDDIHHATASNSDQKRTYQKKA